MNICLRNFLNTYKSFLCINVLKNFCKHKHFFSCELCHIYKHFAYGLYPLLASWIQTLADTTFFPFRTFAMLYEPYLIRTSTSELLLKKSCDANFPFMIFRTWTVCMRTLSVTTCEYEHYPIRAFVNYEHYPIRTFVNYEHLTIRTSAYEPLFMSFFSYEPCVYELLSGFRCIGGGFSNRTPAEATDHDMVLCKKTFI